MTDTQLKTIIEYIESFKVLTGIPVIYSEEGIRKLLSEVQNMEEFLSMMKQDLILKEFEAFFGFAHHLALIEAEFVQKEMVKNDLVNIGVDKNGNMCYIPTVITKKNADTYYKIAKKRNIKFT